jgi:hypothetical protein
MPWVPAKDQPKSGWTPVEKPVGLLDDVKNAVQGGLVRGARGFADQVKTGITAASPLRMIGQAADTADQIGDLVQIVQGKRPAARVAPTIPAPPPIRASSVDPNYRAKTTAGRYAGSIAEMAPAAVMPGSAASRVANMVLPGISAQGAEDIARGLGANDKVAGYARMAGGLLGGVAANVRTNGPPPGTPRRDPVLDRVARGQDPQRVQAETARYRAAGVRPALIDVVDDAARGAVRAAASRQTPARQAATDFRDARALDLPSRVGGQARRHMSQDPRTPDQIREAMANQRRGNADQAFGAVRDERVPLDEDSVAALRTADGRAAINAAADRAARSLSPDDRAIAAELRRLSDGVLDAPGQTDITVGMAQHISEALQDVATTAARNGRNFDAASFGALSRAVRGNARQQVPGYDEALRGYEADSRLVDAANVGENLLTRNTDEFVQQAGGLGDDERALALAAGRRAIERGVGENPSTAPRIARQLADAPEQQARNAALLGDGAPRFQDSMRLEEMRVRNANDIAPRTGSQTQLRSQDASALADGINTAQRGLRAAHGDPTAAIGLFTDWLRSRGINDRDAQRLVETSLSEDPGQIDNLVEYMTRRAEADATPRFRLQIPAPLTDGRP